MRPSPRRWSRFHHAVVAAVIGVLIISGAPLAAWSAPTPSPTPSGSVTTQDEDEAETPPPSENATPADEETPAGAETPTEDESASDEPSAEPSEDTAGSTEPPEMSESAAAEEQSEAAAEDEIGALAIPPLSCTGDTIYQIQRPTTGTTTGKLNAVVVGTMSGTNPVTATQVTTSIIPAGANALGITAGGQGAWALAPQTPGGTGNTLEFTLYSFDVATEIWTPHTASINTNTRLPPNVTADSIRNGGIVAGAIDPLSGNYYWASLANGADSMTIFGWNTTTNQAIGVVANSTLPQDVPGGGGSTNGDIAFDAAGNLYVVSNTGTNAALGVIQGPLPTTQQTPTPTPTNSQLTTFGNTANNNFNGIAFNSVGDLFIEWSTGTGLTFIQKLNPQSGAVIAGPSQVSFTPAGGGVGVDLAACSTPPTLQLRKNVVNRQANTDQFTLAITGGGVTQGNSATTSGTATGVQPQTAGPVVARVGNTYTFSETAAGTTTLANYTTTYECRNQANTVVAQGTGQTFSYAPTAGQAILCTFTNSAPRLVLDKTSTATQIVPGAQVPYTLTVRNTGAQPATNVVVTDTLPVGLTFVSSSSCTAAGQLVTCNLGTLADGATRTINMLTSAANPFPSAAVDPTGNVVNTARVTSPGTNCPTASSTDPDCTGEVPLPIRTTLTLVKTVTNDNGGTALPAAWTLVATGPTTPISGPTGSAPVTNRAITPGAYVLSETGPTGYTGTWVCTGPGTTLSGTTVTVALGGNATCTVNNNDNVTNLTLVKTVTNDNGGTALPAAWTLVATGPTTPISGPTGSAPVTNRAITPGAYVLSETGPTGYTGTWVCTGPGTTLSGTTVTVALGGNATCTVNNNDNVTNLTLVKTVTNDNGGTALPAAWTLVATGPTTPISGPTGSAPVTNRAITPGAYVLSETGPTGYTGTWVCTGPGTTLSGTTVTVALGGNATCTVNNNDNVTNLTLVKTVTNDNGGTALPAAWTLVATGPTTPISGPTGSAPVTNRAITPGAYVLSETGPTGYTGTWVCTGPGTTLSGTTVTVALGGNATCTVNNNDNVTNLTLVKTVTNDNGGTALPAAWTLVATGPTTPISGPTGSAPVTNRAITPGAYVLSETGPTGYTGTWVCTGPGTTLSGTTVTVALGGNATCTVNNNDNVTNLTLVKTVTNDNGGTALPAAWTLVATGPTTPISGPTGSAPVTNRAITPGAYVLSETGPTGYTGTWVCTGPGTTLSGTTVTVALGGNATCTVNNNDQAATLTLVKTVSNGATGATTPATAWTLSADGPTDISGVTDTPAVTAAPVSAGSYVLDETGPDGYNASAWTCTGGTVTGATVVVPLGGEVTCTINNVARQPLLTLVKVVDQAGLDAGYTPADWELSATGPASFFGAGGSAEILNQAVPVGTYDLDEIGPPGFDASDWVCTGAASSTTTNVTLEVGSDATCTITNTAITPTLTLVKNVENGETGADTLATAWTLTAENGDSTIEGATGTDPVTGAAAIVGTYDLSEDGPAGYTASNWVCTGGTATTATSVTLGPGSDATCTITNTAITPTLTLVKNVENGETGADTLATAWTLTAENGDSTIEGATGTDPVTGAAAIVGTYDLSEDGPAGYTASNWVCTGGTATTATSVTLGPGSNATCTITNTAITPTLTLVKNVENGETGADTLATAWTLTAENGDSTIEGATGTDPVTGAAAIVGTYDLSEDGPAGYTASNWVCTGGTATTATSVTLGPGSNATCTITNTATQPTLTLVKNVENGETGTTTAPSAWTLNAVGGTPETTVTGPGGSPDILDQPVTVGTYELSETGPGAPAWTASDWACEDADGDPVTVTADDTVAIALADDLTCTITNTATQPTLTLVKNVENGETGTTTAPSAWTLNAVGGTPETTVTGPGGSPDILDQPVTVGTYELSETGPGAPAWTASDWACEDADGDPVTVTADDTVAIALADDLTCTITNTATQPTLTLVKNVENGETGTTTAPSAWTLNAVGGTPETTVTGPGGSPDILDQPVTVGTYELSETGPGAPAWTASDWACEDADGDPVTVTADDTVAIALADDLTCTITNTATQPTLTLVKNVENGETGTTAAPSAWTLNAVGGTPETTVTGPGGSPDILDQPVTVGTYELSETGPGAPAWTASDWACEDADGDPVTVTADDTVAIALADDLTCTITNTATQPYLTLVKSVINNSGGTAGATDWTLTADGPTPLIGAGGVERTPVQVGDYDLAESTGPTGYTRSDWDCGNAELNDATVSIALGDDVTCTIINTDNPGSYVLTKSSDPASGSTVEPGDPVTYTLTVTNNSDGFVTNATVTDDLIDVLDDATLDEDSITPSGQAALTGTTLSWTLPTPLNPGGVVTLAYTVTVNAGAYDETLANVVTPGPGGRCVEPDDCTTSHPTPHYLLTKSSDPATGATVSPGEPITYTLAVTNDSDAVVSGAVVTDDLSDVLDNTTFDGASITPSGQASLTGTTLTWNVPTINPDPDDPPVVTLSYTVIVNEGAYGVTLRNVTTPDDSGDCEQPDDCTASHLTPRWTLTKLSDPESGTTVNPGDTVTYTLTARNVSDGVVTDGTATDDLSDVLDNATLDEDSITPADAATISGTTLTWTLPNPFNPGDVATLTYTVTVNDGAYYEQLRNVATPGPAGECVAPDAMAMNVVAASLRGAVTAAHEPEWCQTEHPTPGWTLEKSSDPSSGSEVSPGDQVTYTLRVTNDSNGVVSTAVVTDDLSEVLQYASLDAVPDLATLSGTTLTWNVPTVEPGYASQLSYTVTVDDDAYDASFANVATPGDGGQCTTCTTTHETPPEPSDPDNLDEPGLPDTGGTSLIPLGLGAGFTIAGALVLAASRRRRLAMVPVRIDLRR